MAKFKLWLTKGQFQGKIMSVQITANGITVDSETDIVEFDCDLPGQIVISVAGKGQYDTEVNDQGIILSDKFVRVDAVSVDRMILPKYIVESKLFCFVPDQKDLPTAPTNYFAYNGKASINIPNSDSFSYLLELFKD